MRRRIIAEKLQSPSSKLQKNPKLQAPLECASCRLLLWSLGLEIGLRFGIWDLGLSPELVVCRLELMHGLLARLSTSHSPSATDTWRRKGHCHGSIRGAFRVRLCGRFPNTGSDRRWWPVA